MPSFIFYLLFHVVFALFLLMFVSGCHCHRGNIAYSINCFNDFSDIPVKGRFNKKYVSYARSSGDTVSSRFFDAIIVFPMYSIDQNYRAIINMKFEFNENDIFSIENCYRIVADPGGDHYYAYIIFDRVPKQMFEVRINKDDIDLINAKWKDSFQTNTLKEVRDTRFQNYPNGSFLPPVKYNYLSP